MQRVVLKATKRDIVGKKVGALRRTGKLPAVLYGHRVESTPIMLDAHETALTLASLTSSSLVTVDLDGTEFLSLVRDKQLDYLRNRLLHLDFQVVSMTEKIRAKVGIELTGTAPAVKEFKAVIVAGLNELEVECMPQDLPERIKVDISGLAEIGAGIHVRDITLPEQVEILDDPDEVIAVATATKEEAVVEAAPVEEEAEALASEPVQKEKEKE